LAINETDHWRDWLARHGAALVLFARQWSAHHADAEDAVQSGFIRFWKTRSAARDELAYLYSCVRTAAMDLGRGQRRRLAHEMNADRTDDPPPFTLAIERSERQELIEAALKALPGDQHEVVVMKIWGGLTFAQIGQALGISLNTAASRYRYALARLHAELSEEVAHE
jgi:RNA polymerase sigma-70 factor (ECF subfamily)